MTSREVLLHEAESLSEEDAEILVALPQAPRQAASDAARPA